MLGKDKLNIIDVLISIVLINLYISHEEFVSLNNVLSGYYEMEEEIRILKLPWNMLYKKNLNPLCQL